TSFHDALYLRDSLGLRPAPEFEAWLQSMGIVDAAGRLQDATARQPLLQLAHAL
ncbi:ethanolamine ammonia-lyase subunit EutB, partial [Mycobacterium tuberculosis]|nr:ethanolamine ammonia-lyase subunit EutB [Mycobacterium tuberculosis]